MKQEDINILIDFIIIMEIKHRIKTFEFIYCIYSTAIFISIGFIITIFIFSFNSLAITIMFGLDLIAVLGFLFASSGEIEFALTDDKIYIHWIKKPWIRKVIDKTIDYKNIIKISFYRDSILSHQSHIMCQFVLFKETYTFYVADNVNNHKDLSKLENGLRKFVFIQNEKLTYENKIQLFSDY
ncbi:hypothetical protein [Thalassobellus citreus]|uniref:hypothetical protein n=1 Tax=Thalassobellus citreus TaxID=3367752 RepID=UPI0037A20DBA